MKKPISVFLILILLAIFLIYFWVQFKPILSGPKLIVFRPENGQTFISGDVIVEGSAEDISSLHLNGRQIYIDENGHFKEDLLFASGLNIIEVKAKDKFGKVLKQRRMVYINN